MLSSWNSLAAFTLGDCLARPGELGRGTAGVRLSICVEKYRFCSGNYSISRFRLRGQTTPMYDWSRMNALGNGGVNCSKNADD